MAWSTICSVQHVEHILLRECASCPFCFEVNPSHKPSSKIAVRQHRPQNPPIENDPDVQFLGDLPAMTFNRRTNAESASRFSSLPNVGESHRQTSISRTQRQSSNRSNAGSATLSSRATPKSGIMAAKIRTTITPYIRMVEMGDFRRKKTLKWEMLDRVAVNLVDRPLETYASLDSFIHNDLASRWRDIAQDVATTRIFLASAVHAKNGATEVPIEGVEDTTVKEFLENFPKEGAGHLVTTMIYLIIEWDESRRVSYDTKKERTTPEDESLSSITPIIKQEYREPTPIAPIEWEEYQDEIFPENPLDPVTYGETLRRPVISKTGSSTATGHKRTHSKLEDALEKVARPDAWAARTRRGVKDRMVESHRQDADDKEENSK